MYLEFTPMQSQPGKSLVFFLKPCLLYLEATLPSTHQEFTERALQETRCQGRWGCTNTRVSLPSRKWWSHRRMAGPFIWLFAPWVFTYELCWSTLVFVVVHTALFPSPGIRLVHHAGSWVGISKELSILHSILRMWIKTLVLAICLFVCLVWDFFFFFTGSMLSSSPQLALAQPTG